MVLQKFRQNEGLKITFMFNFKSLFCKGKLRLNYCFYFQIGDNFVMRIHPHAEVEKIQRHSEFQTVTVKNFLVQPLLFYIQYIRPKLLITGAELPDLLIHSRDKISIAGNSWRNCVKYVLNKVGIPQNIQVSNMYFHFTIKFLQD